MDIGMYVLFVSPNHRSARILNNSEYCDWLLSSRNGTTQDAQNGNKHCGSPCCQTAARSPCSITLPRIDRDIDTVNTASDPDHLSLKGHVGPDITSVSQ